MEELSFFELAGYTKEEAEQLDEICIDCGVSRHVLLSTLNGFTNKKPLSELEGVSTMREKVWNTMLGRFDITFDPKNVGLGFEVDFDEPFSIDILLPFVKFGWQMPTIYGD